MPQYLKLANLFYIHNYHPFQYEDNNYIKKRLYKIEWKRLQGNMQILSLHIRKKRQVSYDNYLPNYRITLEFDRNTYLSNRIIFLINRS